MSTEFTQQRQFLGHPTGLFVLFFAEMWERFSYYGMRALLVLYMLKGFLQYNDARAYAVYGAYTSLVYMTPFFGGLLADRLLGARIAVIIGGVLMAAGHLVMTRRTSWLRWDWCERGPARVAPGAAVAGPSPCVLAIVAVFGDQRDSDCTHLSRLERP